MLNRTWNWVFNLRGNRECLLNTANCMKMKKEKGEKKWQQHKHYQINIHSWEEELGRNGQQLWGEESRRGAERKKIELRVEIKFNKIFPSFRSVPERWMASFSGFLVVSVTLLWLYQTRPMPLVIYEIVFLSLCLSIAYKQNLFLLSAIFPLGLCARSAPPCHIYFLWRKTITKWKIYLSS